MKSVRALFAASALVAAAFGGTDAMAQNITYTGSDSQAGYGISYSIETNGTLGILSLSDIVSSSITITPGAGAKFGGVGPFTADGSLYFSHTDANGNVDGLNPVSASLTDLFFDYSNGGGVNFGAGSLVYALAALNISDNDAVVYEHNDPTTGLPIATRELDSPNDTNYRLGAGTYTVVMPTIQSFATATPAAAAVPEPATWGMMILGFGVAGAAMRRRVRASEVRFNAKIKSISEGAAA
jgi:hypothetical protein